MNDRYSDLYEHVSPQEPLSSTVFFDKVLSRLNIDLNDPKRQLCLQWSSIVGENLSSHCFFNGLKDGILYVVCDHPSYVSMFRLNSKEVLKNVKTTFPELQVNKVSVHIKSK